MTRIWLVVNPASGSFDPAVPDRLKEVARQSGASIDRVIAFPEQEMPTIAELDAAQVAILAIHTGDGTINAAARALAGWQGAILPLPGGTMNLLSRHIHASDDADVILAAALAPGAAARPVTIVTGEDDDSDIFSLVGIFAGPTTAWGDVRETMRRGNIAALVEAVPQAIEQTFGGEQVRLADSETRYPSIYIEPVDGQLRVLGFTAAGAGDLFRHGFAWLGGDFRNGPHEPLGEVARATILSDNGGRMGLLVDGERGSDASPLRLRAAPSPVRFLVTLGDDASRGDGAAEPAA
jgi:diacylglycerol kinase family enzyme